MNITSVTASQYRRYIPLQGWGSVEAAVNTYATGSTASANATNNEQLRAVGKDLGSLALAFYAVQSPEFSTQNWLVEEMLVEAKEALSYNDWWERRYECEAMGTPLFKATVEIGVLDRVLGIYGLGILAANVEREPEIGLAQHLGIPQAMISSSVIVETEPLVGNRFAFDFEEIVRMLDSVLGTNDIKGETIANAMMQRGPDGETPTFVLRWETGFRIDIRPFHVRRRFVHLDESGIRRPPADTWQVAGSTLCGRQAVSYKVPGELLPPSFGIMLYNPTTVTVGYRESWPIWREDVQRRIIELTSQIADAFR